MFFFAGCDWSLKLGIVSVIYLPALLWISSTTFPPFLGIKLSTGLVYTKTIIHLSVGEEWYIFTTIHLHFGEYFFCIKLCIRLAYKSTARERPRREERSRSERERATLNQNPEKPETDF